MAMLHILASVTTAAAVAPPAADFAFAVPFTDDLVLQMQPAAPAVYGLAPAAWAAVSLTVTDDSGSSAPQTVPAAISPPKATDGAANPLCQRRCLAAGHCALGQVSSCIKPSCAMGCILAARTAGLAQCRAQCAAASRWWNASCNKPTAECNQGSTLAPKKSGNGCNFVVVSPANPAAHLPGETTQNETFQMCADRAEGWSAPPILTNGTECTTCNTQPECARGCGFGDPAASGQPATWKAVLRPMAAGGSYTITACGGPAASQCIVLRRVTFGQVFLCSGQSNMALALEYTFSKPQLDRDIAAGKHSNIRLFQYGDMSVKYEELEPVWVTTTGTINDPNPSGGTWANLTTSSKPITIPPPTNPQWGANYNLLSQFSATCFYFATNLAEQLAAATAQPAPPIGLIQSAIGGSKIEVSH